MEGCKINICPICSSKNINAVQSASYITTENKIIGHYCIDCKSFIPEDFVNIWVLDCELNPDGCKNNCGCIAMGIDEKDMAKYCGQYKPTQLLKTYKK